MAKLVRLESESLSPRRLGILKGQITTTPDFDDPLPGDVLAAFEGR